MEAGGPEGDGLATGVAPRQLPPLSVPSSGAPPSPAGPAPVPVVADAASGGGGGPSAAAEVSAAAAPVVTTPLPADAEGRTEKEEPAVDADYPLLMEELQALLSRHHQELRVCAESWLLRQSSRKQEQVVDSQAVEASASSPGADANHCEHIADGDARIPSKSTSQVSGSEVWYPDLSKELEDMDGTVYESAGTPKVEAPQPTASAASLGKGGSTKGGKTCAGGLMKQALSSMRSSSQVQPVSFSDLSHVVTNEPCSQTLSTTEGNMEGNGSRSDVVGDEHRKARFRRFFRGEKYEYMSCSVIIANAIFMTLQCELNSGNVWDQAGASMKGMLPMTIYSPVALTAADWTFCCAFTLELALRWATAGGPCGSFLKDPWNLFDAIVIPADLLARCLETLLEVINVPDISLLRLLRLFRIVRVARVLRVSLIFRELRLMITSIQASLKSIAWCLLVFSMIFLLFGAFITNGVIDLCEHQPHNCAIQLGDLHMAFGTLSATYLTLYKSVTGGDDWGQFYDILLVAELPAQYRWMYLFFIFFCFFAVINIVSAIFLESAMKHGNDDCEFVAQEELARKKESLAQMKHLFEELDTSGSGQFSLNELAQLLNNEHINAEFKALQLDVHDAESLFSLLDYDHSGTITFDEFLTGCLRLQGESKALDMVIMQLEVRWLKQAFTNMSKALADVMIGRNACGHNSPDRVKPGRGLASVKVDTGTPTPGTPKAPPPLPPPPRPPGST